MIRGKLGLMLVGLASFCLMTAGITQMVLDVSYASDLSQNNFLSQMAAGSWSAVSGLSCYILTLMLFPHSGVKTLFCVRLLALTTIVVEGATSVTWALVETGVGKKFLDFVTNLGAEQEALQHVRTKLTEGMTIMICTSAVGSFLGLLLFCASIYIHASEMKIREPVVTLRHRKTSADEFSDICCNSYSIKDKVFYRAMNEAQSIGGTLQRAPQAGGGSPFLTIRPRKNFTFPSRRYDLLPSPLRRMTSFKPLSSGEREMTYRRFHDVDDVPLNGLVSSGPRRQASPSSASYSLKRVQTRTPRRKPIPVFSPRPPHGYETSRRYSRGFSPFSFSLDDTVSENDFQSIASRTAYSSLSLFETSELSADFYSLCSTPRTSRV